MRYGFRMSEIFGTRRWIVVADSPFLPANNGGAREHLGFIRAVLAAGLLGVLVVPSDGGRTARRRGDDLAGLRALAAPAVVLLTPRRRYLRGALHPRLPYVVASRPAPRDLVARLKESVPDADAVIIDSYKSHEIGRVLATGLALPAVLRQHNLEADYHKALADGSRGVRATATSLESVRIRRDERRLEQASWLSGIADISVSDARVRAARALVPVRYVPPFAFGRQEAVGRPPRAPSRPMVIFLGALDISTNREAVEWFAGQVWPLVAARVAAATWQLVGRRPSAQLRQLVDSTPGLELHGDVARPEDYLATASVAVNPCVSGSGVNIKLLEYLTSGVPVVSTTRGVQGLAVVAGRDLMIEDDPVAFAARVVELLTQPERAEAVGRAGRDLADRLGDTTSSLQTLQSMLTAPQSRGGLPT